MAMDVPRGKEVARRKLIRRIVYIVLLVAAIPLITWGLSRLKPAAPSVDAATVWRDTVKRGPMVRDVRGLGTLVVEQYMWIPADSDGRVEKINFLPGAAIHPNDVLMVLQQPRHGTGGRGPGVADQGGAGQFGKSASDAGIAATGAESHH